MSGIMTDVPTKKCFKKLHISNKLKNSMKKEEEKVNPNSLLALFMLYFLLGLVGDFRTNFP